MLQLATATSLLLRVPQARRRAWRAQRSMTWVLLLARLTIALVGTLQLSSVMHLARDVVTLAMGKVVPDHEDEDDEGECDCPLGCPTCHMPHGAFALPPDEKVTTEVDPPRPGETVRVLPLRSMLARGEPRSLDRPPRRTV